MKVGIIGASGYVGEELVRLLRLHPYVKEIVLSTRDESIKNYGDVYPAFFHKKELILKNCPIDELSQEVDVMFMATPNGFAMKHVKEVGFNDVKVIDMSADYRLKDPLSYPKWYHMEHQQPQFLDNWEYGLCEWNRKAISQASNVANPGCYVTASLLGLLPLVKEGLIKESLIIDAKSGVSGAGKSLTSTTHFVECNESLMAYKVGEHRHTPEIEENLNRYGSKDFTVQFTPHLIPMNRGIHATMYCDLLHNEKEDTLRALYKWYYKESAFVRILPKGRFPNTKWVRGSNYCDIGLHLDQRTGKLIICSTLDNLVKGAAGQGVQNMNIMMGISETAGLEQLPLSL